MSRQEEIKKVRTEKIAKLKDFGMEAYINPGEVRQDLTLKEAEENFEKLKENGERKCIVGRIMKKRGAGKIAFVELFDGTGKFQVVLKADILSKEKMKLFDKLFDMGDFAEFCGTFFVTEKGQNSLLSDNFKMLTKSLLPLPEKWHGLSDTEEIYRKRYLDIATNPESFKRFVLRSKMTSEIRSFLNTEGYMEIETPILQSQASGAMAETFKTYHNDYNMDMVLRISLEAEHKMTMAGGYPAIYEIGKNFRNEGSDPTHIQEFTMIEWYRAYRGLDYNLKLTERLLKHLAKEVFKKEIFKVKDSEDKEVEVNFFGEWTKVDFNDLLKEYAKIDVKSASREELEQKALDFGGDKEEISKLSLGNLLDFIYKKSARKHIINPTFVMHYPAETKPLAIQNPDGTAEMAQLIVAGAEITNQYAELVDPIVQRKLLQRQSEAKKKGDAEAMDMNEAFLEAMEHGMPPMTGTGIGIDRLFAFFAELDNLRDTILFPIMRKENKNEKKE